MSRKPRKWWATLGTMVTVVEAPLKAQAIEVAVVRFNRVGKGRKLSVPAVKLAKPEQIARFEAAMEQVKAGPEAARLSAPEVVPMEALPL